MRLHQQFLSTTLRHQQRNVNYFLNFAIPVRTMSTTIDKNEISNFSRLSAEWWDERGPMKALHTMNTLRVPWIAQHSSAQNKETAKLLANVRILDVGCGCGLLSEPLARLGANVMGVDASEECINVADRRNVDGKLGISYVHQDLRSTLGETLAKLDIQAATFDAVVASEVVEHVSDRASFIRECVSLVRPGGHIFLTTINRTLASNVFAIYGAEYIAGIVPKGTHQHDKFVTPDELTADLIECGCIPQPAQGMIYNPLFNTWSWSSYTSINYAIMAEKN
jgi:ubiquinone biosynthesis O-methyltransferase